MRAGSTSVLRHWLARGLAAVAIAGGCSLAHAAQSSSTDGPGALEVVGVRFGADPSQTRMVIETNQPLSMRMTHAAGDAQHIVLSLPGVVSVTRATPGPLAGEGLGLVKSWRLDAQGPRGARLELVVAQGDAITHRFALAPAAEAGSFRYVIDVGPTPAATEEPGAEAPGSKPPSSHETRHEAVKAVSLADAGPAAPRSPRLSLPRRVRKVIVVDAGHGGHDPGAQAADLNEKDITLATALALRRRLERDGRYRVVMTRDSDEFIPLPARVQIARHAGADLFISLHADSAGDDADTHGASVYTLSDHGESRVTEVLGQSEWFTRTGNRGDPAVGRILLDLTQRSTLNRSALFAGLLIDRVSDKIDLLPRTHRDAGYYVLLAPDVPAVLLEMGFISSPRDQVRLTDAAQRTRLTDAIAGAIDAYFDGQPDHAPAPRTPRSMSQARNTKPAAPLPATQPG